MIASLPMYDWPEVRQATDEWWAGLARHLGLAAGLDRGPDYSAPWHRPDLLFSQTCGYPFAHALRGKVRLVATPNYGVDGCQGPNYRSIVFAREAAPPAAFRGGRAAINHADSMSGMLALKLVFAPLARNGSFFGSAFDSGGHVRSMAAVRDGKADVCAVDAVCVALARRYRPDYLEGLVEIARSPMVPGLPYVTAVADITRLRMGLAQAFADPTLFEAREMLFLTGHSVLDAQDYERIVELETAMERAGGLALP
ncbi:MAG: phosphate/phosphite/phosphonate ABC transporter substrate-binding protein [Hyphomicrobiales bacterium]